MTPKELLYIEDVLSNEKQLQNSFCNFASQLQDTKLKTLVQDLSEKHRECFSKFYNLVKG